MQFVETQDLKTGMRLARPIYSREGVLLFDRNSHLTVQAIDSIRNFGLFGVYVLDPAEPLPPMSEEELELERFRTMAAFSIQDELEKMLATKRQSRIKVIAGTLLHKYGYLEGKIQFSQGQRSRKDFVFRHSLNVAILCTMITHVMNVRLEEQMQIICAALVHDAGKLWLPQAQRYDEDDGESEELEQVQCQAAEIIERAFSADGISIRRICTQAFSARRAMLCGREDGDGRKLVTGAKILLVANRYDELTAMSTEQRSESEVRAIREFREHPEIYDKEVVKALLSSVSILPPGVGVELNTGEKALVLAENTEDVLRPVVLSFKDNSIIDLSMDVNEDIQVKDILKTLDNRYSMDAEALKRLGYK